MYVIKYHNNPVPQLYVLLWMHSFFELSVPFHCVLLKDLIQSQSDLQVKRHLFIWLFHNPLPICAHPPTPQHRCDPTLHLFFKVSLSFHCWSTPQLPVRLFPAIYGLTKDAARPGHNWTSSLDPSAVGELWSLSLKH